MVTIQTCIRNVPDFNVIWVTGHADNVFVLLLSLYLAFFQILTYSPLTISFPFQLMLRYPTCYSPGVDSASRRLLHKSGA